MNRGDVRTQFLAMMNRGDLKNNLTLANTFVDQSIIRIQRELRAPFMEKQIEYTIPSTYTSLSIPSDLLELISIEVDTDGDGTYDYTLRRTDRDTASQNSQILNMPPRVYARRGGAWVLGPKPTAGSLVLLTYYAEFAPLVIDTDSNTLSTVAWDAIVYGALSAAADYFDDDRLDKFEKRYASITQALQNMADADELTADAIVTPALVFDDDENL